MDLETATWRKSTWSSGGGNGDCVEVAVDAEAVAVRDSEHPHGHVLVYGAVAWVAFLADLRAGRFGSSAA